MPSPEYSSEVEKVREEIAARVNGIMETRNLTPKEFAEAHFEELGFCSSKSARIYLSSVRTGKRYGSSDERSKGFKFKNSELEKHPKLFRILGIGPEDPLIDLIRTVEPDFRYHSNEGDGQDERI